MLSDKEQKKKFKVIASKNPEKYYPVEVLKRYGFERKKCVKCGTYFWTTTNSDVCGDPACVGGFSFIDDTPAKNNLDYIDVWKKFSKMFSDLGYTPIKRYPVVARWRDDTDFVQASIYDFQPHVVNGSVKPPANPLVVPQFSLRFNDIDNVGITGSHYTGFVMIGQHAFMPPEKYDQKKYFEDIYTWLSKGLGLSNDEIKFHEDAWAGGGNFGPSMEFFSRGLELGNQVYMQFEQTPTGGRELKLKVLDMGMGQERNAWFTKGKTTSYETTFPTVVSWLKKQTSIVLDKDVMKKFLHYSSMLNADEVENIDEAWSKVAKLIDVNVEELKSKVLPLSALYSVAEHTRTLLMAITDGALPSNVSGGHNLRVILRRSLSFLEKYNWNFDYLKLFELHSDYYKRQYSELGDKENLDNINKIVNVEIKRFKEQRSRSFKIIKKELEKNPNVDFERLKFLYESYGITPELFESQSKLLGYNVKVDADFYSKLSNIKVEKKVKQKFFIEEFEGLKTKPLYFDDWKKTEFKAKVIAVKDNYVVLDETYFYPTSGGQLHDLGTINGYNVVNIFKQGNAIVHELEKKEVDLKEGSVVECKIDWDRRLQLAQHHTATHILNYASKKILGKHIWQAGAEKRIDKARLDITHYQSLTREEEKKIEELANNIVEKNYRVIKTFMPRDEAEKEFGFVIYQGGAVPGDVLRIVKIVDENNNILDVEACGGTHLDFTKEVEAIKILKTSRISDGVVRIEFVAGSAAKKIFLEEEKIVNELLKIFNVKDKSLLYCNVETLFNKWKKVKKLKKKNKIEEIKKVLEDNIFLEECYKKQNKEKKQKTEKEKREKAKAEEKDINHSEILEEVSSFLKTQKENVVKTILRFKKELDEIVKNIE